MEQINSLNNFQSIPKSKVEFYEIVSDEETSMKVSDNSQVVHYRIIQNSSNVLKVTVGKNSIYRLITFVMGNSNLDINVDMLGEKGFCKSDVVYVEGKSNMAKISTFFQHNSKQTKSSQLIKGVVSGNGKADFLGRIYVPYNQKEIEASQQHRALLLSRDALVKAVPMLEIYSDDVKCAHGSAIGSLDQDQLYYLKTRGIESLEAHKILTHAFLNEVCDDVSDDNIKNSWENLIQECLEQNA